MDINKKVNGEALEIALTGRLDTTTAPQLDEVVKNDLNGITSLVFDLNSLEYISSATSCSSCSSEGYEQAGFYGCP